MAIKKSELYGSLWSSCDELRGGMDASQYKDYVLSLLFIKYISDKYCGVPYAPITIPPGADFKAMVALKGATDIGDQMNKKIIAPLAAANDQLSQADFPDFNDAAKLGEGKEKAERLSNLIAIFESQALDFSKNRAEGDDILGDAYEYLMRHFATESGKSKGQFYTPAEVSRVMAQIIGIRQAQTSPDTTVYDPTCGSGSLLLKVGDEAITKVSLYGQEKDSATSGLARMNMILHDNPTAQIAQGNTITDPKFKDGETVKQFDFVVANPPFSDKRWSTGLDPLHDPHTRFAGFGIPSAKQGDYAYLLHIVRCLKSTGSGACILPHGVLFRGNAEADIRKALVRKGYIKGIIGLPANLFYGTGIPACIVVVDKKDAQARKGIFMIDAAQGFMKDGPKNRLRSQDIHKIVDAFTKALNIPGFSRTVPFSEIEKNDFNLNLPRYIDSQKAEDRQDIEGHLRGGIPQSDIDALKSYWDVCPNLKTALLAECRPGYANLTVDKGAIKSAIFEHPEFSGFMDKMDSHFDAWRVKNAAALKSLKTGIHPKDVIADLSEGLLAHYTGQPLIDKYDVYQHLMDYWAEVMQDDCYTIALDGWKAETYRIIEKDKKGKEKDKGWTCDLIPKSFIVARFFADEQAEIDRLTAELEAASASLAELEEEHGGDDGAFAELDKINKVAVNARLKEIKGDKDAADEAKVLKQWLKLSDAEAELKKQMKKAEAALDVAAYAKYPKLTEAEIKTLVVDDKWMAKIDADIHGEMDRISQALAQRVGVLAERYESAMPELAERVAKLESKMEDHLKAMGFAW
ncbi:type I restriction endonuclease subunit M [Sphingobium sp. 22B]|uniref:type I restriction-modification system subunit M n=1 Tax=unclassified Sphingobium TaxID=2611147 RepID=UPI0007820A31|nr:MULTISPECIES: type I restriction-modification system subunit M [unclassified Sphingobium]KXU29476.1 type I restriction endonuclease subunit M [Sphingobium sp. AM]KYC29972.1 type I restriction endonuclease subunit M [Sphingobium sp. 22B]OAP30032.1 type I restriction-modification system subunit M [Sphingobium sp. 20006FA]